MFAYGKNVAISNDKLDFEGPLGTPIVTEENKHLVLYVMRMYTWILHNTLRDFVVQGVFFHQDFIFFQGVFSQRIFISQRFLPALKFEKDSPLNGIKR